MSDAYLAESSEPPSSGWKDRFLGARSSGPTWAGLVLAALGFGLLAFAWGKVAGLTNVALQVPYLVSSGFTGLGLIAVGCTLVSVQARRQDAAARDARLAELAEVLQVLEQVSGQGEPEPSRSTEASPSPRARTSRRAPRKTAARR